MKSTHVKDLLNEIRLQKLTDADKELHVLKR